MLIYKSKHKKHHDTSKLTRSLYIIYTMAKFPPQYKNTILVILLFSYILESQSHKFSRNLSPKSLGLKKEKLSHLHFYFDDIVKDTHSTVVRVAEAAVTNTSRTLFGAMFIIDDPLTLGPERTSKIVGRAQGMYAFTDLNEIGVMMDFNFVFVEGKYNGSTLSIMGRNSVLSSMREMAVVGGSGIFRFARGYALAKTHLFTEKIAIVEYDVYVLHY